MNKKLSNFYDHYHQKNNRFHRQIRANNFTYWYILKTLRQPLLTGWSKMNVLDVGCGVGTLALYLSQFAHSVTGIDVSPRALKLATEAKQALGVENVSFLQKELQRFAEPFQLILCTEVIEHIADDKTFAKLLASNVERGGWLLLSTPNRDNWLTRLGYYKNFDTEVGHLRRYNPAEISQLLQESGFSVEKVVLAEGPLRSLLFTSKFGILIKLIKGPLIPLFHWVDDLAGRLFGCSDIIILAQKK